MFTTMEDVLSELHGGDTNEQGLPPGFRFHPTDEELITFYLASKVFNGTFCGVDIAEIDLNRCEPWELPDIAKMGEREWYFFSQRDRKYPTGLRTNRATEAGYWKATGKDREVYSATIGTLLGMKKTLVFYKGRAPRGVKTKWVMHEYRLEGDFSSFSHFCKDEWVLCRILHKIGLERKFPTFQTQSYLQELISSTSAFFPQMPQNQTITPSLQNSILRKQETDFKTLLNPCSFPPQSFTTSFQPSLSATAVNSSLSPMMFKTLLSHQDNTLREQDVTDPDTSFSHFQPLEGNFYCMDKPQQNLWQDPPSFEVNCSGGLGSSAEVDTVHDMSTSVAYSRSGFQMVLDPPIIRY